MFRKKQLFITTCIEKHCTWPLISYILFIAIQQFLLF